MPDAVRINRYLAAAGLGTRREVEGLIRTGRVTINGAPCATPSASVGPDDDVRLDGATLGPGPTGAVVHRIAGAPLAIVHPGDLHAVLPLPTGQGGLELLLADATLARRLEDPRHPLAQVVRRGLRVGLGPLRLDELAPGAWRPLTPRELAALRRGARLPPRAG